MSENEQVNKFRRWYSVIFLIVASIIVPWHPYFKASIGQPALQLCESVYSFFSSTKPVEPQEYIFNWYICGVLLSMLTLGYPMGEFFIRKIEGWISKLIGLVIFLLLILHLSVPLFIFKGLDFVWFNLATSLVFVLSDVIGIGLERKRNKNVEVYTFTFPLVITDLPMLVASVSLLRFFSKSSSPDFYNGMSAGSLAISTLVYVGLMGVVLPEITSRRNSINETV